MASSTVKSEKPVLDIAIINLSQVVPVARGHGYKTGREMDELFPVVDGAVGISGKKLMFVGKSERLMDNCTINANTRIIDGRGKIAFPDSWTHTLISYFRAPGNTNWNSNSRARHILRYWRAAAGYSTQSAGPGRLRSMNLWERALHDWTE